jgi:exonuclease VII small subunit
MYEKGVAIAGECMSMLNEAEQKIKIISDIKPEIEDEN